MSKKQSRGDPVDAMLKRHIDMLKQGSHFIRNGCNHNDSQLLSVAGLVGNHRVTSATIRRGEGAEKRHPYRAETQSQDRHYSLRSQRELTDEYEYQQPRSSALGGGQYADEGAQVLTAINDSQRTQHPLEKGGMLYFPGQVDTINYTQDERQVLENHTKGTLDEPIQLNKQSSGEIAGAVRVIEEDQQHLQDLPSREEVGLDDESKSNFIRLDSGDMGRFGSEKIEEEEESLDKVKSRNAKQAAATTTGKQMGTLMSQDTQQLEDLDSTNLQIQVAHLNRPKSANMAAVRQVASRSRVNEQSTNGAFTRPVSSNSRNATGVFRNEYTNQQLDPILIKLWNLIRSGTSLGAISDCLSAPTSAHTQTPAGLRAQSAVSRNSRGSRYNVDDTNLQKNTVREKDYYRLLISMQVGLFLVNENYMLKAEKLMKFQKKWQRIARKSIKGFTFRDFKRDIGVLFIEGREKDGFSDIINSDFRQVMQTISTNAGGAMKALAELICLSDLKELFMIKMKELKSQAAEPNGKQTGVGDVIGDGLENFTMGQMASDQSGSKLPASKSDDADMVEISSDIESQHFQSSEDIEKSFNQSVDYLIGLYRNICSTQAAYLELMYGTTDFGSQNLSTFTKRQEVTLPSKQRKLRSALTRTMKEVKPDDSANNFLVSQSQNTAELFSRPIIKSGPKPHTVVISASGKHRPSSSKLENQRDDIITQIEKANQGNEGATLKPNASSILNFAFNIDNNQNFYKKSGEHKLSIVAQTHRQKKQRPKSAATTVLNKHKRKRPSSKIVLAEEQNNKMKLNIMKGVYFNREISRLDSKDLQKQQETKQTANLQEVVADLIIKRLDDLNTSIEQPAEVVNAIDSKLEDLHEIEAEFQKMGNTSHNHLFAGTGTDVNSHGQRILHANSQQHRYSTLFKSKDLGGRSGIAPVQLCQPPPMTSTIHLGSRWASVQKNKEVSKNIMRKKDNKRVEWLQGYNHEIKDFKKWQTQQILKANVPKNNKETQNSKKKDNQTKGRNSRRASSRSAQVLKKPGLRRIEQNQATPNYIQEYFENQNVFPNPKQMPRNENDELVENIAQEQAYWTQMGTATFQLNKRYRNPNLEVSGGAPFHPRPISVTPNYSFEVQGRIPPYPVGQAQPRPASGAKATHQPLLWGKQSHSIGQDSTGMPAEQANTRSQVHTKARMSLMYTVNTNVKRLEDLPWEREGNPVQQLINENLAIDILNAQNSATSNQENGRVLSGHSSQLADAVITDPRLKGPTGQIGRTRNNQTGYNTANL